jgi:hypothetical protein
MHDGGYGLCISPSSRHLREKGARKGARKVPGVLAVSTSNLRPQFISHLLNLCSTASRLLSHHSAL